MFILSLLFTLFLSSSLFSFNSSVIFLLNLLFESETSSFLLLNIESFETIINLLYCLSLLGEISLLLLFIFFVKLSEPERENKFF